MQVNCANLISDFTEDIRASAPIDNLGLNSRQLIENEFCYISS